MPAKTVQLKEKAFMAIRKQLGYCYLFWPSCLPVPTFSSVALSLSAPLGGDPRAARGWCSLWSHGRSPHLPLNPFTAKYPLPSISGAPSLSHFSHFRRGIFDNRLVGLPSLTKPWAPWQPRFEQNTSSPIGWKEHQEMWAKIFVFTHWWKKGNSE